jgi:hypothetical protein
MSAAKPAKSPAKKAAKKPDCRRSEEMKKAAPSPPLP